MTNPRTVSLPHTQSSVKLGVQLWAFPDTCNRCQIVIKGCDSFTSLASWLAAHTPPSWIETGDRTRLICWTTCSTPYPARSKLHRSFLWL